MPSATKATYSLDAASLERLARLARRWQVSKTEVIRRALSKADESATPSATERIAALHELQRLTREREIDLESGRRQSKMAGVDAVELIELDSNFLVAARARGSGASRQLQEWLGAGHPLQISAVAWSEYLCGPPREDDVLIGRKLVGAIDPFLEGDAELASVLFNNTGRRTRSHADCMIAAHAIRRGAHLATLNLRDFRRFEEFHLKLMR